MEEYGIFSSNEDSIRLALAQEDARNAIHLPTDGWPSYSALYEGDPPAPFVRQDLRTAHLFALDHKTIHNREGGNDIASKALAAAGTEKVRQEEWQIASGICARPNCLPYLCTPLPHTGG